MDKRAIIEQLKAPSTWRGIVLCLSALGYSLRPDVGEAVIAAGMAIAGLIGVFAGPDPQPPAEG